MASNPPLRTIVYEEAAEEAILWLSKRYPRLRHLLDAWELRLSRAPGLKAVVLPGSNPTVYIIKTLRWLDLPQLTFYYDFDEHTVTVKAIHVIEPGARSVE